MIDLAEARRLADAIASDPAGRDGEAGHWLRRLADEVERLCDALHPWYGPCDGFADGGECSECQRLAEPDRKPDEVFGVWAALVAMLRGNYAPQASLNVEQWEAADDALKRLDVIVKRVAGKNPLPIEDPIPAPVAGKEHP